MTVNQSLRAVQLGEHALLGAAAGMRATLGITSAILARPQPPVVRAVALAAVAAELVWDKLPNCPSRLDPGGLAARIISAAIGSVLLSRGKDQLVLAVPVAVVASMGSAALGTWWRRGCSDMTGRAWPGAAGEDLLAVTTAGLVGVAGHAQGPAPGDGS